MAVCEGSSLDDEGLISMQRVRTAPGVKEYGISNLYILGRT